MNILSNISIKNFKCFRDLETFSFARSTYFIGINNAGKTAVLNAIKFFFDDSLYNSGEFLNRTLYLAKKAGYNRAEITVEFDVNNLSGATLKNRLIKSYKTNLIPVTKFIIFTPDSKIVSATYQVFGKHYASFIELPEDIVKVIKSVHVIYIHPQEGKALLIRAQEKLRQRLLANWGRGPQIAHSITELQEKWNELRAKARGYLSTSLTASLQKIWPESKATIDLPKDIKEIVAISDINFQGYPGAAEIELASHGTGAQSTILYLTHFLLDSDRSLHKGEYHPVWLLEEPESFLHADLVIKFAQELNSDAWLENIQMMISTHSAILLAVSRVGGVNIRWNLLEDHKLKKSKAVLAWEDSEVNEVGKLMGDSNFLAYFVASQSQSLIFLEDKKEIVAQKFKEAGIDVLRGLEGVTEIAKYIDVFINNEDLIRRSVYFIVDSDKGASHLSRFLSTTAQEEANGFKKFKIKGAENIFVLMLPNGFAVENLFDEYENHLENCISKIWDIATWRIQPSIPSNLTRACSKVRAHQISSLAQARGLICNEQDVKDIFWEFVASQNLQISKSNSASIKKLLGS